MAVASVHAHAGGSHLGSSTRIERVRVYDGWAVVYTESDIRTASCATRSDAFILTLEDGAYGDRKYSTLLTALTTDRVFNPWCPDQCRTMWGQAFTRCTEAAIR